MDFRGIDGEFFLELSEFFYSLGFFGELILIIFASVALRSRISDLIVYYIGICISALINRSAKPLFKDARPLHPIKFLASEHFVKNSNAYGLPSGHSQSVFFSITYLYLTLGQFYPWALAGLVVGLATFIERYVYHNHTISQLVIGAGLGAILAYGTVYVRDHLLVRHF